MTFSDILRRLDDRAGQPAKRGNDGNFVVRCPGHDDRTASLSVKEGAEGQTLLHCFAGCSAEEILRPLGLTPADLFSDNGDKPKRKASSPPPKPCQPPTYIYTTSAGQPAHGVTRTPNKQFFQCHPDPTSPTGWRSTLGGVTPVLYRLPEILGAVAQGLPVFIVEGEKDADNLAGLGLAATTNCQGAGKWRKSYSKALTGAEAIIVPDNDKPGEAHALAVAASLAGLASSVKILQLPGLPNKGDVSDWIAQGGTGEALLDLVAEAPEYVPQAVTATPDEEGDDDTGLPVADRLVELALAECQLFRDPADNRYARLPGGLTCALQERGGGLRDWLARRWRQDTGRVPHAAALAAAGAQVLAECGVAPVVPVALRVGEVNEHIIIDLGASVVRVTRDGWTIIPEPDEIRFARPATLKALPTPWPGGEGLEGLRQVINFSSDDDFVLTCAWLLAALRPGYPYPLLVLTGEQGSAKSTATRILRSLVDPHGEDGRGVTRPPRDDRDLWAVAAGGHVLALDNLSSIGPDLSDSLSALATGAGLEQRRLYTDGEVAAIYARKPIILNGIGSSGSEIASRADLLDRALCVNLTPIPDADRLPEKDLWPVVDALAPSVLAHLLDATATALRRLPSMTFKALPRMADFAAFILAAEPALPWNEGQFIAAYTRNREEAGGALLDTDPVASYLQWLSQEGWSGSPTQLHEYLQGLASDTHRRDKFWPRTAAALGRHLARIEPALRTAGVTVRRERLPHTRGKIITIKGEDIK